MTGQVFKKLNIVFKVKEIKIKLSGYPYSKTSQTSSGKHFPTSPLQFGDLNQTGIPNRTSLWTRSSFIVVPLTFVPQTCWIKRLHWGENPSKANKSSHCWCVWTLGDGIIVFGCLRLNMNDDLKTAASWFTGSCFRSSSFLCSCSFCWCFLLPVLFCRNVSIWVLFR